MAVDDGPRCVIVLPLQQGSEAWLKARKGEAGVCVGSSLLGAVAGLSLFKTTYEAYKQLVSGKGDPQNRAMAHGHQFERVCADNFRKLSRCPPLHEAGVAWATAANPNFSAEQRAFYAGSIDRWGCDCGGKGGIEGHFVHPGFFVVECKCPFTNNSFRNYYGSASVIKQEHLCQLHLQMALFNLKRIFYTASLVRSTDKKVLTSKAYEVTWSAEYWEYVLKRANPVVRCALDAYYGGVVLDANQLTDEIVRDCGEESEAPPVVEIKTLW